MQLEKLMQKRAALDQKIEAAKVAEKRKIAVADLAEKAGILGLSDSILQTEFSKIRAAAEQKTE